MPKIESRPFGKTRKGDAVSCWTLRNRRGMSAEILTYGGILRTLSVPAAGTLRDVVLGFDNIAGYEGNADYIGAAIGRVANRIGSARFTLDAADYSLPVNSGPNCLHGGPAAFDKKVWSARPSGGALVLSFISPAGESGFPGELNVQLTYSLGEDNAIIIDYRATCDAPTIINLTNHSYFNLKGAGEGTVEDHKIQINADHFTETDAHALPTGTLVPVAGTPFDLRTPRVLSDGLAQGHPQLILAGGYDHNFILKNQLDGTLRSAAVVTCGGLRMECQTTQPGLQLYTGNFLSASGGKGRKDYCKHSGLCLETQNWPDAINHAHFPSPVLRPGEVYHQKTIYRFAAFSI
jgi:aldose 1-epimerase